MFQLEKKFHDQAYLEAMYKAIYSTGYYALLRVGEMGYSRHVLKAKDVHEARNKKEMLIVLHSSKTHNTNMAPQKIRVYRSDRESTSFFCPVKTLKDYIVLRGTRASDDEQFFVFPDKSPVTPDHIRSELRESIRRLNLDEKLYDTHSLRSGRATDLRKFRFSIQAIKEMGRWRSNAVFKYLK